MSLSATKKSPRQLRLGLFVHALGQHVGGWRHPDAMGSPTDLDWLTWIAQSAERRNFDMLFLGDSLTTSDHRLPSTVSRFEPLSLLSALAARTQHIGLAATASTTLDQPFHLARAFSSLDHLSGGRAAWNVVTSFSEDAASNIGIAKFPDHATRYEIAGEFLEVCTKLWDAWKPGAIVKDKATGRYLDDERIQSIHHKGKSLTNQGAVGNAATKVLNANIDDQYLMRGETVIKLSNNMDVGAGEFAVASF